MVTTRKKPRSRSEDFGRNPTLEIKDDVVQATKHDANKTRFGLYPIRSLEETCKVFTWAATDPSKYSEGNWFAGDGFSYSRLIDAAERHLNDFKKGEELDEESGFHLLAHVQCCIAMLLEHVLTGHGTDDRAVRQYIPGHKPTSGRPQ